MATVPRKSSTRSVAIPLYTARYRATVLASVQAQTFNDHEREHALQVSESATRRTDGRRIALNTSILTHPTHSRASSLRSLNRSRFKPTFLARRDAPVSPDS